MSRKSWMGVVLTLGMMGAAGSVRAEPPSPANFWQQLELFFVPENAYRMDWGVPHQPIVGRDAQTPAGRFNGQMIFLADQIDRNSDADTIKRTVAVTTFANLHDLGESSELGRLLAEQLMHELKVRGWQVADLRMARDFMITPAGEFSMSRNPARLGQQPQVGTVVAGTYSVTGDGVLVSARVVDLPTGSVLSSAQTRIEKDAFASLLVDKPVAPPAPHMIKVTP